MDPIQTKNLAETLADVLPSTELLQENLCVDGLQVLHYAVPKGHDVKELRVDLEAYMPKPRKLQAKAEFHETESFLAYIARHANEDSVCWCDFNPQTYSLSFRAVIDEHGKDSAAWRHHVAAYKPRMSAEWQEWKSKDRVGFSQVEFAEWLQDHERDIASVAEHPSCADMLQMATNFQYQEDRRLKSAVRLQSGGVRLDYVADADAGTVESMRMFEKFAIGIPIFHGAPQADLLTSRLKYRLDNGKVRFTYELQRADKAHEKAALDLIQTVRGGLAGVPLLFGICS
ncbi:MAG: DUF2303 family protein [Leptothrix sp. (in: b-proteobacteria)]